MHKYLTKEQLDRRVRASAKKARFSAGDVVASATGSVQQWCPSVFDQGQLGSCTANAFCGAYMTLSNEYQTTDAGWTPSRLWVYYQERVAENPGADPSTLGDTGADVTDAESCVQANGVCSDSLWPYDITTFDQTPTPEMISDAANHKITGSAGISIDANLASAIESAVASGIPVLTAVSVYQSFEGADPAQTGMIPIPTPVNWNDPNDPQDPYLGGHEILIVGYDQDQQLFTFLNSWGTSWGASGYGYFPYAYITNPNLGLEFTTISVN